MLVHAVFYLASFGFFDGFGDVGTHCTALGLGIMPRRPNRRAYLPSFGISCGVAIRISKSNFLCQSAMTASSPATSAPAFLAAWFHQQAQTLRRELSYRYRVASWTVARMFWSAWRGSTPGDDVRFDAGVKRSRIGLNSARESLCQAVALCPARSWRRQAVFLPLRSWCGRTLARGRAVGVTVASSD